MGLIALAFAGIVIVMFVAVVNSRRSSRPARRAPEGGDGAYYGGDVMWMDSGIDGAATEAAATAAVAMAAADAMAAEAMAADTDEPESLSANWHIAVPGRPDSVGCRRLKGNRHDTTPRSSCRFLRDLPFDTSEGRTRSEGLRLRCAAANSAD